MRLTPPGLRSLASTLFAPRSAPVSRDREPGHPRYVDRAGETVWAHPVLHLGTRLHAFGLRADPEALARVLERHLDAPSGGAVCYRPAAPLVVLGYATIGAAHMTGAHTERGRLAEIDLAFWIPAFAMTRVAGVLVPQRLVWFQPYIFVDSTVAVVHGRELYGFPKAQAWFDAEEDEAGLVRLDVETTVLRRFGVDEPNVRAPLLRVRRGPRAAAGAASWRRLDDALAAIDARLADPTHARWRDLRTRLVATREVRMVFLKQFRDVADGTRACYQAIVEAPARVRDFAGARALREDYSVALEDFPSHPIARDLGLGAGELHADFAACIDFDFVMEAGTEVWRAGVGDAR